MYFGARISGRCKCCQCLRARPEAVGLCLTVTKNSRSLASSKPFGSCTAADTQTAARHTAQRDFVIVRAGEPNLASNFVGVVNECVPQLIQGVTVAREEEYMKEGL